MGKGGQNCIGQDRIEWCWDKWAVVVVVEARLPLLVAYATLISWGDCRKPRGRELRVQGEQKQNSTEREREREQDLSVFLSVRLSVTSRASLSLRKAKAKARRSRLSLWRQSDTDTVQ